MKQFFFILTCAAWTAAVVQGQEMRIGGHIGAQMDGNMEVDSAFGSGDVDLEDGFAYGAQLTHRANEAMSLEISGTRFSTELENASNFDFDVITFAVTLRLGGSPSPGVYIYGGGGGNYNIFDADGFDAEDEFGYHFCGGLELPMNDTTQFFAEYRMTYITLEDDFTGADLDYEFGLVRAGLNFRL